MKNTGKIISHSGTHGTGKTTTTYFHAGSLKISHPDYKIGIISNVARGCPFPINRKTTPEAQNWIFCKQLAAELEGVFSQDIVVSDRSVFDCIAYTRVAGFSDQAQNMIHLVLPHYRAHYKQIIFHPSCHDFNHADGVRSQNNSFRDQIETELLRLFNKNHINFIIHKPQTPNSNFSPQISNEVI